MANTIKVKRGTNLSNAGTPAAGELIYKTDTRALYVGDGSTAATSLTAIAGSGGEGDIDSVTAGNGLDGGGSSGNVTLSVDVSDFMSNGSSGRILRATGADTMSALTSITSDGTHLRIADSSKFIAGAGDDLQMYHDGTNNIIKNNISDQDFYIKVNDGGTANVNAIHIDASETARVLLPNDNQQLRIGAGQDLQLWHDGSNSYISQTATGDLYIRNMVDDGAIRLQSDDGSGGTTNYITLDGEYTSINLLQNTTLAATKKLYLDGGSHTYFTETSNDLLDLYVGGVLLMRFEETGTDSVFTSDNVHLGVGTHKDLRIYHNSSSSNNNIENHSGSLYVTNYVDDGDIILRSDDGSGGVTNYLQLDGGSKFLSVPSDSVQFTLGASSDIRFYHDGSNSQLKNYTGAFYISQNTASTLYIDQNADDSDIVLRSDDGSGGTTAYLTLDGSAKNINFFGSRIYLKNDGTFHWGSSGAHGVLSWDTGRAIVSGLGSNNLDLKAASGYQVVVNETQSNVDFRVESDSSANLLHCDATLDKIGIGTNAPLSKLHVEGKAFIGEGSTNETEFPSNTASLHIHEIVNDSSGVDLGNEAHMVISTGVNATGAQGYQGSLWFGTSDHPAGGTGSGNQTQFVWRNAGIASYTSADTGAGSASGNLEFFTNNASSTATKRMTITEAGLVGIGIASPTSPLHVYAGDGSIPDDANNHLLVEDNAHSYIGIGGGTSSDTGIHFMDSGGIRGRIAYKHSSDSMDFKTANSVQMTIDSNGDVGIGTTSPGTKLEIKAGGDTSQEVIKIRNNSGTEIMTIAAIDGSGDGYINFNSSPGIINTNSGNLNLDPAGDVVVDGASLYLPVAEKLYFGAGGHTYIGEDVDDRLRFFTGGAEFMRFTEDTANILSLYQNTYLNDDLKLYFGSHSDVYMYYEPTNDEFYIRNVTGDTKIRNEATDADIIFSNDDGSGGNTNYMVIDGGAVSIDLLQDTRLKAAKKLFLDGGGNTYIYEESADNVMFYIGGRNMLRLHEGNGEVVVNDSQVDTNFRVESDTIDDLFFCDAGTSRVGIGTNGPGRQLTLYGEAVIRLDSTGDPGIDFNTSGTSDMQFRYRGSTDKLSVYSYGTSTDVFTIQKADGRVGIGTTSPDRPLNVNRSGDGNVARFSHSGSTGSVDIYSAAAGGLINVRNGSGTSTINIDARNDKINLIDSIKLTLGTGNDLEIYHNGSHNYFDTNNGNFYFRDESDNNLFTIAREGNGIQVYEGDIVIPATGKLRLDNSTSGDTYIYEESANVMCFRSHGSDRMKIGPYGQGVMISENFGGTDDYVHINPANGGNRTMTITGDNIDVITNGAGSNNLNLQANGGNVVFGGAISGVSTLTTSSTITTGYGVALTNGATNFLMYNNTNDNILYMRDTTNSAMIQTWGVNNVQIHKGLIINETGGNYDTRIEGDTDTDLFYIDASTDRVGISTNTPGNLFTVQGTSGYQASIQHDASTRLRISVEGSGRSRFYTDNSANVGIESGGLYVQPTKKFFLDGGLDTWLNEPTGNTIGFGAGGAERMRMTTTGLGIGTASPSFKLKVNVDNGLYTDWETIAAFQSKRGADSETEAGIMINSLGDALGGQISSNWYWTDNTGAKGNTGRSAGIFGISNSTTTNSEFYWQNTAHNNTTLTTRMKIDNAHSLHVDADVVAYSTSVSDERFKDNIETIPNALDKVMQLRGVEFDWNATSRKGQHDLGVVAQEVEKVLPELVKEKTLCTGEFTDNEKEFKTVDYDKIVAVLIEAVKQQQEEIELLKANYDDLKYNRR